MTDPVKEIIKTWLQEDKSRPVKQRRTAHRIYERLVEEYGFQGGESTVRRLVAQLRDGPSEVHIPLAFNLGQAAQCDWGEAQAIIAGEPRRIYFFCMRALRQPGLVRYRVPAPEAGSLLRRSPACLRVLRGRTTSG